jgi:thiamine-phosphate pyrophosphorylase
MPPRLPDAPFLYPIVDVALLQGRSVGAVVAALARGGAALIQLRVKTGPDAAFVAIAEEALAAARRGGIALIVNDRPDIVRLVGADGVHLGQDDLDPREVRAFLGSDALLGLSTHSLADLEAARGCPVDYVAVGPVFRTTTKANAEPTVGTVLVAEARRRFAIPVVAIGGIQLDTVGTVFAAGASGAAVAAALLRAPDVEIAFRALDAALRGLHG